MEGGEERWGLPRGLVFGQNQTWTMTRVISFHLDRLSLWGRAHQGCSHICHFLNIFALHVAFKHSSLQVNFFFFFWATCAE